MDPNSFLAKLRNVQPFGTPPPKADPTHLDVQWPGADIYDHSPVQLLNPLQLAVGDQVAMQVRNRQGQESAMKRAFAGETFEEQAQSDQAAAAEKEKQAHLTAATAAAEDTAGLDEKQFNTLLERLRTEMSTRPTPPVSPGPEMPNAFQLGASLIGSILAPNQAAGIISAPFQASLTKEAQDLKDAHARYEADLQARNERLQMLMHEAGMANDRVVSDRKLAADATEADKERASKEKIAGIMADSRIRVASIKEGSDTEKNLLSQIANADTDPQTRALYADMLRQGNPQKYAAFDDQVIEDYAKTNTPKQKAELASANASAAAAGLSNARAQTENDTRALQKQQLEARIANFKSNTKLNDERAKMVASVTKHLDDESAAKVALAWAGVDNVSSMIDTRDAEIALKQLDTNRNAIIAANKDIGTGLQQWHTTAEALRKERDKLAADKRKMELSIAVLTDENAKKALKGQLSDMDTQLAGKDQQIRNAQAQYKALADKAEGIRRKIESLQVKPDPKAGAAAERHTELGNDLVAQFGGRFEQWNDRDIRGKPGVPSMHATGRAIDYYNTKDRMAELAQELIQRPDITRVIYNRQIWDRRRGWHEYTGTDPHTTHIHIERN